MEDKQKIGFNNALDMLDDLVEQEDNSITPETNV